MNNIIKRKRKIFKGGGTGAAGAGAGEGEGAGAGAESTVKCVAMVRLTVRGANDGKWGAKGGGGSEAATAEGSSDEANKDEASPGIHAGISGTVAGK